MKTNKATRKRSAKPTKKRSAGKSQSERTKSNKRLRTALEYAKVGLRVAPMHGTKKKLCTCGDKDCKRPGQHPRTPNGIADATSKPEDIKEFWTRWPNARIGIATGVAGMIAVKVTEAGEAALDKELTSTNTVEIRDGKSRIFLWKTVTETIPEGSVRLEHGVTVLGRKKFIIAPDDLDASEGTRRFVQGIRQVDIAAAPDWLLARLRPRLLGITAMAPSAGSEMVKFKTATIDVKFIYDGPDRCDPEEVKLRARSISETGPRMPPAVRLIEDDIGRPDVPVYEVLTDRCYVEALKSLGATTIKCVVVDADEDGGVVWQLAELFNRPEQTVLRQAELAMKCVAIVRRKGGQHARGARSATTRE